ncbi:MAG: LptA/OstA family protein [Veillonellales bacterium]
MKNKFMIAVLALFLAVGTTNHLSAQNNGPVEMAADSIEYDAVSGVMTAQGAVQLTQANAAMTGASARYNTKTRESYISGGVKVVQDDAVLTAAEVRGYDNTHLIATGDVVLVKGDNRLTGPQIDYYSDKQYAVVNNSARLTMPDGVMTAAKLEAFLDEERAVGEGDVHIVSETRQLDAVSDQAVYYGAKNGQAKAVLTGNARAIQQGNVLTGNTLTIYMDDKVMDAQGRTKLIINQQ